MSCSHDSVSCVFWTWAVTGLTRAAVWKINGIQGPFLTYFLDLDENVMRSMKN